MTTNEAVNLDLALRQLMIKKEYRLRKARESLWTYCRVVDDRKFYYKERWHLRLYTDVLQMLHERRLNKANFIKSAEAYAPLWFTATNAYAEMVDWMDDREYYDSLMINLPPRIGKTRTLTNATSWYLGRNSRESVITATYNDDTAQEFSKAARNNIGQEAETPFEITHQAVFPGSKLQHGAKAASKWNIQGGYQSYIGVGLNGSVTGKGGSTVIVDDPIKDSKIAYNKRALDEINSWYRNTLYSRKEKGALSIINHTRWSKDDLCGHMLSLPNGHDWFVFKLPAFFEDVGEYLDPTEYDAKRYNDIKVVLNADIFSANYNQKTVDLKGKLYSSFSTYKELPRDNKGNPQFETIVAYTDTADTGADYLTMIIAGIYQGRAYVLDVLHTDAPMTETEIAQADKLVYYEVVTAKFEGNNGGSGHARSIEKLMFERHKHRKTTIEWFHQSENKVARILSNQTNVMNNVLYPEDWETKWPSYYDAMTTYQRKGKNVHDDAPDATTGLVEHFLERKGLFIGLA